MSYRIETATVAFVGGEVSSVEYALKRQIHAFESSGNADMARVYRYALEKLNAARKVETECDW